MGELLNRKAIAAHFQVSEARISQLVTAGKLREQQKPGLGWVIDVEEAAAAWEGAALSVDHVQRERATRAAGGGPGGQDRARGGPLDEEALKVNKIQAQARAKLTVIKMQDAELEFAAKQGTLVSKAIVEQQVYAATKLFSQRLAVMPDRMAAKLAILTDPNEVRDTLGKEIETILADLKNELARAGTTTA